MNIKFYNLWQHKNRPKFLIWFNFIDFRNFDFEDYEGSIIITIFNFCWIINPKES